MAPVYFHYNNKKLLLDSKKVLRDFIGRIFLLEKKKLQRLDYIFCGDEFLLEINKNYLMHNYYTDIITFNLSENKKVITGEIYISIDRIKENALQFNSSFTDEALRVIFHGALHLCGYNDKTKKEREEMLQKENKYLILFKNKMAFKR